MKSTGSLFSSAKEAERSLRMHDIIFQTSESQIVERMMRCGIEARAFQPETEEELRSIAIATLKIDAAKYALTDEARRVLL